MARRDNKKARKAELEAIEAPDIVEEELWSLSEWVEKHWKPVLTGLVAVSVVWGGVGIYQMYAASQEKHRADNTAAVFDAAWAMIVPPSDSPDAPPPRKDRTTFETETARADAVIAAAKSEDPKAATALGLVVAGAKAVKGDREGQVKAIDAALATVKGQALELPLHEQKATALTALGKTAEAAGEWAEVSKLATTDFAKALAKLRTGDLYGPDSKTPDAAKAKAAYAEALKLARPGDKDPSPGPLAFVAADARGKLARL